MYLGKDWTPSNLLHNVTTRNPGPPEQWTVNNKLTKTRRYPPLMSLPPLLLVSLLL
jgi:hypothetical protein